MTRLARITFAALVVATFGAFFVTQRLKRTPPAVQGVRSVPLFSPNSDGRKDRARISFTVKSSDDVTVDVITTRGDRIRRLADDQALRAYRRISLPWDGRGDDRRMVPDGTYRYRVALRREGRSVTLPVTVVKDTTPPKPLVLSIGPTKSTVPSPEIFPNRQGKPMTVRVGVPGSDPAVLVYRTDTRAPELVLEHDLPVGATSWSWNGTGEDGRKLPSGTYLVAVRSRDKAGNVGTSPDPLPPRPAYGTRLAGRGGVQISSLAAAAPTVPVAATAQAGFLIVSDGRHYSWSVRRVGERDPRSRGGGTRARVDLQAPGGRSGLYLFDVRTATRSVQVPFAVQSVRPQRVLVVLPAATWQGRNRVDDDGDGWPDTLDGGRAVRTARPYAGAGLPAGVAEQVAPLLIAADKAGLEYDITTDIALARGQGPTLKGHTGVILPGETRWMDGALQRSLRTWVRQGGRLWIAGQQSLRRSVTTTPQRLVRPTQPTATDLFGARLRPVQRVAPTDVTNTVDRIDLFRGTDGQIGPFTELEGIAGQGTASRVLAVASTPDAQNDVIVAARSGDGIVLRTGLPELASKLSGDPELVAFLKRTWTLLRFR